MMVEKLVNLWIKRRTKNFTQIALFVMTFDYRKYKKDGKNGSCTFHSHPKIAQDPFVKEKLCEVVYYIRGNYDLEEFTKI